MVILTFLISMISGHQKIKRMPCLAQDFRVLEFLFYMVTLSRSFLYLKVAVVKWQGESRDLVSSVSCIMEICGELK